MRMSAEQFMPLIQAWLQQFGKDNVPLLCVSVADPQAGYCFLHNMSASDHKDFMVCAAGKAIEDFYREQPTTLRDFYARFGAVEPGKKIASNGAGAPSEAVSGLPILEKGTPNEDVDG